MIPHTRTFLLINILVSLFTTCFIKPHEEFLNLFHLGNRLHYEHKFEQAIATYNQALALKIENAAIHLNLGITLKKCGRVDEAITEYKKTLIIDPNYTRAYNKLAEIYLDKGEPETAAYYAEQAYERTPNNITIMNEIALSLIRQEQLHTACQLYKKVLTINPKHSIALYNMAFLLSRLNCHEQALEYYKRDIACRPDNGVNRLGLAKSYLAIGNFEKGWPAFEYRFFNTKKYHDSFGHHLLVPNDFAGKRVLLHAEWGLGDTMQFVRYAKLIKNYGGTVILQTFKPLVKLLSRCDYIETIIDTSEFAPPVDLHVPLLSLPMIFKTRLETIPTDIPYIEADPDLVTYWQEQLASDNNFKIGICWHAKPIFLEDYTTTRRSIPLRYFAPLAHCKKVTLYSLQKIYGLKELEELNELDKFALHTFDDNFDNINGRFMDTAAVIKNCDLIITADTSIVHLAGALGAPVWVILPYTAEWRWLHDRTDSPWYANMRLFRQKEPGNWQQVMQEVVTALQEKLRDK